MPECHFMEMVEEPIETEQVEPDAEFPGEPDVAFEPIWTHFHCERENPAIQYLPVSGGDGTPASAGQVVPSATASDVRKTLNAAPESR